MEFGGAVFKSKFKAGASHKKKKKKHKNFLPCTIQDQLVMTSVVLAKVDHVRPLVQRYTARTSHTTLKASYMALMQYLT